MIHSSRVLFGGFFNLQSKRCGCPPWVLADSAPGHARFTSLRVARETRAAWNGRARSTMAQTSVEGFHRQSESTEPSPPAVRKLNGQVRTEHHLLLGLVPCEAGNLCNEWFKLGWMVHVIKRICSGVGEWIWNWIEQALLDVQFVQTCLMTRHHVGLWVLFLPISL